MLAADARRIGPGLAQILAAAAMIALSASQWPARAGTNPMLVIPASDGYGFDDCLAANKPCGRTIADAWCEAHGMAAAISFGRAEDVTGALVPAGAARKSTAPRSSTAPRIDGNAFIVNCRG